MATKEASKSAAALRSVLQNHKASEIETAGKVIEITADTSPIDATKLLWKHNILGAPVWDESNKKYVGFFDMRVILSAAIASHKELGEKEGGPKGLPLIAKWFEKMNASTLDLAAQKPFVSCKADTSLEEVCRILNQDRCHRIPIVGDDGRCVSIISQSALVKFLVAGVETNATALEETLEEAQLIYKKDVISATDTTPAIEVFELLDSHRLSGIAVVDEEDGRLVSTTSARDIKLAILDEGHTANIMDMDILSYLAAVRQATLTKKEKFPFAHVAETSTVGHAIRLLAKTGYHRVFVVDEQVRPVGVISVADVIRFVVG